MRVRVAEDYAKALAILENESPFDAAIVDVESPADYRQELFLVLSNYPSNITLALLTPPGNGAAYHTVAGGTKGLYLSKPLKIKQLYSALLRQAIAYPYEFRTPKATGESPIRMHGQKPLRILLAEDNVINQKLALRILNKLGYRADIASNGAEALEALRRQSYDAILMDLQMPEMDGLEATRRIRDLYRGSPSPRIIALTASAMQGDRERCLAAGMDDYIAKPIRVEELRRALLMADAAGDSTHGMAELVINERAGELVEEEKSASIDTSVLLRLKAMQQDGEPDIINELFELFVAQAEGLLQELRKAFIERDWQALMRTAHLLQGSCAGIGANTMLTLCAMVEEAAHERAADLKTLLTRLEEEFARTSKAVKSQPKLRH
jgi:CheY-like chemotaxis protein/HPt (histidine-containing phosphotransfer) domain-containing protein